MPKKISFIIILLFTCHLVVGQEDTPDQRIERLSQKRLTYYWFGFFAPHSSTQKIFMALISNVPAAL